MFLSCKGETGSFVALFCAGALLELFRFGFASSSCQAAAKGAKEAMIKAKENAIISWLFEGSHGR